MGADPRASDHEVDRSGVGAAGDEKVHDVRGAGQEVFAGEIEFVLNRIGGVGNHWHIHPAGGVDADGAEGLGRSARAGGEFDVIVYRLNVRSPEGLVGGVAAAGGQEAQADVDVAVRRGIVEVVGN